MYCIWNSKPGGHQVQVVQTNIASTTVQIGVEAAVIDCKSSTYVHPVSVTLCFR